MKMNLCDVCLSEGKMTVSGWIFKIKKGFESLRVDVCQHHKGIKIAYDGALELLLKAQTNRNELMFPKVS